MAERCSIVSTVGGDEPRMPFAAALAALHAVRRAEIVITTMGAAREWPKLPPHPLDLHYIPSAMGQAPSLGLGLALARPEREVIVVNGDGCQLMNLGSLVTIAASGARNLTLLVLDNGRYEVTGGQQTAARQVATAQGRPVDFVGLARAAGWPTAERFATLESWQDGLEPLLKAPGPRFAALEVASVGADYLLDSPGPLGSRLATFVRALETG